MTIEELINDIVDELRIELKSDPSFSEELLRNKVTNAVREVKRARRYPKHYTDLQTVTDLANFSSNIRNLALYDYNQIGIEGQSASTELGDHRTYVDRNTLFRGVIPLAR